MSTSPAVRPRCLAPRLLESLRDTPALFINGPRQCGKSTLCVALDEPEPRRFVTLDDGLTLAAAQTDPDEFVAALQGPVTIDEVQRVPDLFRALKRAIDRDRRPGRFLLTGSTSVFALPKAAESLAGRMEIHQLWTFSQGELENDCGRFVDDLFSTAPPAHTRTPLSRQS